MDFSIISALSLGLLVLYLVIRLLWANKQNPAKLKQKIRDGALVLDVRTPAEFGDGHYHSAINIPVDDLATRLNELGTDKSRSIIVYCAGGPRAGKAAKMLTQAGFTDVTNAGGLFNMPRD